MIGIDEISIRKGHVYRIVVSDFGFAEQFLDMIHQGRVGSFSGREEGERLVKELLGKHDLSVPSSALAFAEDVLATLRNDMREKSGASNVNVADQLRTSTRLEDLYDFLFGFSTVQLRDKCDAISRNDAAT